MEGLGSVPFTTACHRLSFQNTCLSLRMSAPGQALFWPYYVVSVEILTTAVCPVVAEENVS